MCADSAPIFLLTNLFLHLGDIVSTALTKPGSLRQVLSFILSWLTFWEASYILNKHHIENSARHQESTDTPLPLGA